MLKQIQNTLQDFSRLLFPHSCLGCGAELKDRRDVICYRCQLTLPFTNFFSIKNNPVEKSFYGRLNLAAAAAAFYFTKDSLMQILMAELKYKQNISSGFYLGRMMGYQLLATDRFSSIDIIIPMPLHPRKEKLRSYNQATIISKGIQSVWKKPIIENAVFRNTFSMSQTLQDRIHRWQNMEGIFSVKNQALIQGKHLLLVDDVTTTGASLEALGAALQVIKAVKLSVATAAYTI